MMNADYDKFVVNYVKWLKDNIETQLLQNDVIRVTLPYLDKDNDEVEVFIIPESDGMYRITDGGETIDNLELSGFSIKSQHRKELFTHVVNSFGVEFKEIDNSLQVRCDLDEMPVKKHMLAQCMVKVSDMFYLTKSNVQNVFLDDVRTFFDANGVRYIEDIILTGKSKLETHYDFAIPKSVTQPERLVQVMNTIDMSNAKITIFSWNDTYGNRKPDSKLLTIINDSEKKPSGSAITALKEYGIDPILWSGKESRKPDLIA